MKPVAFLILIGALVFVAVGYSYSRIQTDLIQARKSLTEANSENQKLRAQIVTEDAELDSLRKQVSSYEAKIQALNGEAKAEAQNQSTQLQSLETSLTNQRQLTDQKRKDYQAMLTGKPTSNDAAAIRKNLNDEIATLRQRLNAVKDETARTRDDANHARDTHRSNVDFANSQEKSRLDGANQQLGALKKQRSTIASQKGNPMKAELLQEIDTQIGTAQGIVNQLHGEQNRQRDQEHSVASTLDAQIRSTIADLSDQQHKLEGQLQAKQNQMLKLDGASAATGEYQKERAELIKRMAAELQDETEKLKKLEAQVTAAKVPAH